MDDGIPYPPWKFEAFSLGVHCRPRHRGRVSVLVIVPAYLWSNQRTLEITQSGFGAISGQLRNICTARPITAM